MTTIRNRAWGTAGVLAVAAMAAGMAAQQPSGGSTAPQPKVIVAGENPAITLRDKEGGQALTSVNFWRVHWSPVGDGAVCFVTVTGQGAGDLRLAIHNDPKVLDYVTRELMSSLQASFNTPPYTPVLGTITQSGDMVNERRETCRSDSHTVRRLDQLRELDGGRQLSYLNESCTRVRYASTLPFSIFRSI